MKCGSLISVRDGRVVKIGGNSEHPHSEGAFCVKGMNAPIAALEHPDRPLHPLRRTGERGSGQATQPAAAIFIPLVAIERGIPVESLMVYYLGYGLVGITARGLFGGLSDRIGRGLIISFGTTTTVVALVITSQAGDIILLTLGGVLFGLGSAAFAPSVMALAIDVAPPERRGAAMATYSMAFQLAQGLGGLLGGILIDTVGYQAMYLTMILAPVAAQVLVFKNRRAISMANLGSPF